MEDAELLKEDKLILRGLKFHGFHGVKPEEKKLGQKFLIDVDAWMDLRKAGKTDCISDTVSYTDIYRIAKEIVEGQPQNLLESVAQLIASNTLTKHPQISAVRVKVGKPHVAVHGLIDYLGVEILRYRSIDMPNCQPPLPSRSVPLGDPVSLLEVAVQQQKAQFEAHQRWEIENAAYQASCFSTLGQMMTQVGMGLGGPCKEGFSVPPYPEHLRHPFPEPPQPDDKE